MPRPSVVVQEQIRQLATRCLVGWLPGPLGLAVVAHVDGCPLCNAAGLIDISRNGVLMCPSCGDRPLGEVLERLGIPITPELRAAPPPALDGPKALLGVSQCASECWKHRPGANRRGPTGVVK